MKYIVETNLGREWCSFLIENGHKADYWLDIGDPAAEDISILEYAKANNAII